MKKDSKNIEQFLNDEVRKTSGFSMPKNYLDSIENNFIAKLAEQQFPKSSGYKIPEEYLDSLENSIVAKVGFTTKKETKVITLKNKVLKIVPFAAAASVLVFLALNTFNFKSTSNLTFDSLNNQDLEYWYNTSEINYTDLALVLENEIKYENEFTLTNIQDENIEEYMNSIDNSSILNDLN